MGVFYEAVTLSVELAVAGISAIRNTEVGAGSV
jgi:hypothetical protein